MIHIMLPSQYLNSRGARLAEPHKNLMAAVLRTVVDDCRGASIDPRPVGHADLRPRGVRQAIAYVASTDRAWPYSFENLCDALGLSAEALRQELNVGPEQVRELGVEEAMAATRRRPPDWQ